MENKDETPSISRIELEDSGNAFAETESVPLTRPNAWPRAIGWAPGGYI
jgi:hypothetical protein